MAAGKHLVAAHALVTNSAAAKGVLTAINWFVKYRPFAEKVFASPRDALVWMGELLPELEADRVLADIERSAPGFRGLRW